MRSINRIASQSSHRYSRGGTTPLCYTPLKRVTCLWNRCISRYIILEQLKESHVSGTDVSPDTSYMSLEQMYLQIHHTGTVKRVTCLWNRCISRYIILEQLKESHVSGTDVSPDTSYWNSYWIRVSSPLCRWTQDIAP